jgi:hypothetical protein
MQPLLGRGVQVGRKHTSYILNAGRCNNDLSSPIAGSEVRTCRFPVLSSNKMFLCPQDLIKILCLTWQPEQLEH